MSAPSQVEPLNVRRAERILCGKLMFGDPVQLEARDLLNAYATAINCRNNCAQVGEQVEPGDERCRCNGPDLEQMGIAELRKVIAAFMECDCALEQPDDELDSGIAGGGR